MGLEECRVGGIMKADKSVKVTSAWIEQDRQLRCRGIVEDMEIDFVAAKVGLADKDGNVWTLENLKTLLASIQEKIKKNKN